MPIKKSAFKHLRQTKKRTAQNSKVKRELKEFIKGVRQAVSVKDKAKLEKLITKVPKLLDNAAEKKVIKKNNAARRKSRLIKQINTILNS